MPDFEAIREEVAQYHARWEERHKKVKKPTWGAVHVAIDEAAKCAGARPLLLMVNEYDKLPRIDYAMVATLKKIAHNCSSYRDLQILCSRLKRWSTVCVVLFERHGEMLDIDIIDVYVVLEYQKELLGPMTELGYPDMENWTPEAIERYKKHEWISD